MIGQGGSLVAAGNGVYYGITGGDGDANGDGTIFQFTVADGITVVAYFDAATTGIGPVQSGRFATLMRGSEGDFYGTTSRGGANGYGTISRFSPTDFVLTPLYPFTGGSFTASVSDGGFPVNGLAEGTDHSLYG